MEYGSLNMSNKAKEAAASNDTVKEKLVLKGVNVVEHKAGFFERLAKLFMPDDIVDVKGYLVHDVLVPGVRDLTADLAHSAVDAVVLGNTNGGRRWSSRKNKSSLGGVEYSSIFASNGFNKTERTSQRGDRIRPIIAESRGQAEDLLTTLMEYIDTTGSVSVGQLYGALEWDTNPNDFKWGWESLGAADVVRVKEGYLIKLPRPQSLV